MIAARSSELCCNRAVWRQDPDYKILTIGATGTWFHDNVLRKVKGSNKEPVMDIIDKTACLDRYLGSFEDRRRLTRPCGIVQLTV